MRSLASKPNVVAPGGDYPFGRIKDNPGDQTGTPVNEEVYGDFHQFFEKLMSDGGVVANDDAENSADGFQLNEALDNIIDAAVAAEEAARILADDNLQDQIDLINDGQYDATMNTDGGGIGVVILTIPVPADEFIGIDISMVSSWVSGGGGAGNGGHVRKIATYKNVAGVVSAVGAVSAIHTQVTAGDVPTLSFQISGTDVEVIAQAGSGSVYSVRAYGTAK